MIDSSVEVSRNIWLDAFWLPCACLVLESDPTLPKEYQEGMICTSGLEDGRLHEIQLSSRALAPPELDGRCC